MILLSALSAAAALLLVWAGVDHVRDPAALRRRLGGRWGPAVALAVGEIIVGTAALGGVAAAVPSGRFALAGQSLLYLGFTGYLAVRYRKHDRADCACTRAGARIGVAALARAGAFGLISVAAAASYPAVAMPTLTPTDPRVLLAVAAAVALCLLAYAVPPAIDGLSPGTHERRQA